MNAPSDKKAPDHLPANVASSSRALTQQPSPARIVTRMAESMLIQIGVRERSLAASQRRYRIGDYEFRQPDHEQIQRWAKMLEIAPEELVQQLDGWEISSSSICERTINFEVRDGAIVSLPWKFDELPLTDWAWVAGLGVERLAVENYTGPVLPTLPDSLCELNCSSNQLTELDLQHVPALASLNCSFNRLTSLNLRCIPRLTELDCSENQLTEIDLRYVAGLTSLDCGSNQISKVSLLNVPKLTLLICNHNKLTELNLLQVPKLTSLVCSNNGLREIDLHCVPGLIELECGSNDLTEIDLSPVPSLTTLVCLYISRTELDLRLVPRLTELWCNGELLKNLDLSQVPNLLWLNGKDIN